MRVTRVLEKEKTHKEGEELAQVAMLILLEIQTFHTSKSNLLNSFMEM